MQLYYYICSPTIVTRVDLYFVQNIIYCYLSGAFASGIDSQKHVRFESPCYQGTHFPITSRENMENIPPQTNQQNSNNSNLPPFEKIYMANVPNRHLDLSIIEPTKVNHNKYRGDYQEPSERSLRIINNNQKPIEPTYRHNQSRPGIEMHEHFPRDNLLNGNTKSPKVQDFNKDMLGRNIVYNNSKKGEPIVDMYNYKRANVLETDRQIVENMQLGEYTRQNQVFSGMVNNKVDIRGRVSQENRCSPCSEPVIRRDSFGADILSNLRKNEDIQTRNDKVCI